MLVWKNVLPDRMVFRMRSCSASDMPAEKLNVNKPEVVTLGGACVVLGAVGLPPPDPLHPAANIPLTSSSATTPTAHLRRFSMSRG